MSTAFTPPNSPVTHELHPLRAQWWCFLLLGAALIFFGTLCIINPLVPSLASIVFLGFLLMAAGIAQIVSAFWAGKWSGMLVHILIGVLYAVVGYMVVDAPVVNMVIITKFIAIFLVISGVFRIVASMIVRFHDWGWALLNGGITLLLGIIINRQLPEASLWVIGTFIGIEMIFNGWAWVMLSLGLRAVAKKDRERAHCDVLIEPIADSGLVEVNRAVSRLDELASAKPTVTRRISGGNGSLPIE